MSDREKQNDIKRRKEEKKEKDILSEWLIERKILSEWKGKREGMILSEWQREAVKVCQNDYRDRKSGI